MIEALQSIVLPYTIPLPASLYDTTQIPLHTVIEVPANWFGSRGVSAKNSEAIQKLYYLAGGITESLIQSTSTQLRQDTVVRNMFVILPSWKGQVPKEIMVQRAHAVADLHPNTPHDACEALLLAVHAFKHFRSDTQMMGRLYQDCMCPYTLVSVGQECRLDITDWMAD